jgi:hypothetical protein
MVPLLPWRSLAEEALPRPNPLGHLLSPIRRPAGLESLQRDAPKRHFANPPSDRSLS